jgi:hypothetical protein
MPRLETPIGEDGPIIDIRTWVGQEHEEALNARRLSVPPPFSIRGLVDTGAKITAIQWAVAEGMGLRIHDWITLKSSVLGDEARDAPIYQIRMTFGAVGAHDPPKWRTVRAVGVTVVSPGALALIGQDLLATCRFTYDGRRRRLMLSY